MLRVTLWHEPQYFQFSIQDPEWFDDDLNAEKLRDVDTQRFYCGDGILIVFVASEYTRIPITVEFHREPPALEGVDQWDRIVECPLVVGSDEIVFAGCPDGPVEGRFGELAVEPGSYRVRLHYGGQNTQLPNGHTADHYLVQIWASDDDAVAVLKAPTASDADGNSAGDVEITAVGPLVVAVKSWLSRHAPRSLTGLREPVTARALAKLRFVLPKDTPSALYDLLSVHDGQAFDAASTLFPEMQLLSADEIARQYLNHLKQDDVELVRCVDAVRLGLASVRGPVYAAGGHSRRVPFATMDGKVYWTIDLTPAPGGHVGQIVEEDIEDGRYEVLAPSLPALLRSYLHALRGGLIDIHEGQVANDRGDWPLPSERLMHIRDITLDHIRRGCVWRVCDPDEIDRSLPLEEYGPLEEAPIRSDDLVVYSGLIVEADGSTRAIVMMKTADSLEYWGDCCEFVAGRWRQRGLEPNPDAPMCEAFIAAPLPIDPSYDSSSHDERQRQADGFRQHVGALR